jgi:uncharacterized membrane protein
MALGGVLVLLHLVGFAAFLGGAFAQQQLMRMSARDGLAPAVRDEYERLAAAILTKVEVPALFAQVVTGIGFIAEAPEFLHQHWLHAKLTAVVILLLLSHLEMFNARRLVRARAARGDEAKDEIADRKKRHATMGAAGAVLVVAILLLVTVLRTAF